MDKLILDRRVCGGYIYATYGYNRNSPIYSMRWKDIPVAVSALVSIVDPFGGKTTR
jgi:hypothetical protein